MAASESQGQHTLPKLGYSYDALEPAISAQIMELHHSKHHQAYVDGLNNAERALAKAIADKDLVTQVSLQGAFKFHGGGHTNHSLFWKNLKPVNEGGGRLGDGALAQAIRRDFCGLDQLKEKVNAAALAIQGSGWVWLGYKADSLIISTTKDQDPLIDATVLFGIDMWEHAFYLQYLNKKADYVKAIWSVIDFDEVGRRYEKARGACKAKA